MRLPADGQRLRQLRRYRSSAPALAGRPLRARGSRARIYAAGSDGAWRHGDDTGCASQIHAVVATARASIFFRVEPAERECVFRLVGFYYPAFNSPTVD